MNTGWKYANLVIKRGCPQVTDLRAIFNVCFGFGFFATLFSQFSIGNPVGTRKEMTSQKKKNERKDHMVFYQYARAAGAKGPTRSGLEKQKSLTALGARNLKSGCWQGRAPSPP